MEGQPIGTIEVIQPQPKQEGQQLTLELAVCYPKEKLDPVWDQIKPYVEELANASAGEYNAYSIYNSLLFGVSHLYMGYLNDANRTFVGYLVISFKPDSVHIWQAYIMPAFRHTNVFQMGAGHIEAEVKKTGCRTITFSATKDWSGMIEKIGFVQGNTIFRKELK